MTVLAADSKLGFSYTNVPSTTLPYGNLDIAKGAV